MISKRRKVNARIFSVSVNLRARQSSFLNAHADDSNCECDVQKQNNCCSRDHFYCFPFSTSTHIFPEICTRLKSYNYVVDRMSLKRFWTSLSLQFYEFVTIKHSYGKIDNSVENVKINFKLFSISSKSLIIQF